MKGAIAGAIRRPILLGYVAAVSAALCALIEFNPFTKEFGSFTRIFKTDYVTLLSDMAYWLHLKATDTTLMAVSIMVFLGAALAVSAVLGVLTAGYAYMQYVTELEIEKRSPRGKGAAKLFVEGVNRRFGKMIGYFMCTILSAFVMIFLILYSIIPGALSIKTVMAGDTSYLMSMVLIIVVTLAVLFFGINFYTMYVSFSMPSIIAFKKGSIKVSFRMVNGYCWYLLPRTIGFVFYMAAVAAIMLAISFGGATMQGRIIAFLINWLLTTCGLFVYSHFVFSTYIAMKEDMFS